MTSGFGVDPTKDGSGNVISGTTSSDIQKIWGGLYTPGVVSGCAVSTSPSGMTYTNTAGVVMIPVSSGLVIPTPVAAGTVNTLSAPSSGTRTDIVYAQQRFPSIEGDSEAIVSVGQVLPQRAVKIAQYSVPAGAANTAAATVNGNVDYSIPYGGSLGILHQYVDQYSGVHNQNNLRLGSKTITLPTDRLLRFSIQSTLWADGAAGFDNAHYCEWYFRPEIDNVQQAHWQTPGLHQAWALWTFEGYFVATAGTHTVSFSRGRQVGPGSAATMYGQFGASWYPGTTFTVEDAGVVK